MRIQSLLPFHNNMKNFRSLKIFELKKTIHMHLALYNVSLLCKESHLSYLTMYEIKYKNNTRPYSLPEQRYKSMKLPFPITIFDQIKYTIWLQWFHHYSFNIIFVVYVVD